MFRRVDWFTSRPVCNLTDCELVCQRIVLLPYSQLGLQNVDCLTGQFGDKTTSGQSSRGLVNSRITCTCTCRLMDWQAHELMLSISLWYIQS